MNRLCIGLLGIVLLYSCQKLNSLTNIPPDNPSPDITAIGSPIGNLVSKTIGSGGGSLTSDDGKVQLTIPAGALAVNTDISIQAVTNQAPGGIGSSYQLMPEGIKFSVPVTLTFNYTAQDINGTMPYLLYIAFQDSTNAWEADIIKRNVDTIAKTVSLGISHFSIWTLGESFVLVTIPSTLHEDDQSTLQALYIVVPAKPDPTDAELISLPITTEISDYEITSWKVNGGPGNSTDGTITGKGNNATYTAPSNIPEKRTVTISVDLNDQLSSFNNGRLIASVNKLTLVAEIDLLPSAFDFSVYLDYKTQPLQGMIYEDKATFDLSIKVEKEATGGSTVTVVGSNYQNNAPTCTPLTLTFSNGSSWTCVPGSVGETNITGIQMLSYDNDSVYLELLHTGATGWGAHAVDAHGNVGDVPGLLLGNPLGFPTYMNVALQDISQTFYDPNYPTNPWIRLVSK